MATLEGLKAADEHQQMDQLLLPADAALDELPLVRLSESGGFYMRQGQPVMVPNAPCDGIVRVALETGEFLGVAEILDDGRVAPRRLIVTGR
jgi:tRNA pseudouridine55 synthase